MAQKKIKSAIVEKNVRLTQQVMRYLLANPQTFNYLPDKFELVILPQDDAELRLYNLELLDKFADRNRQIVFARIKTVEEKNVLPQNLKLFAPLPLAA